MTNNYNKIEEIIIRYPHETVEFISNHLKVGNEFVRRIAKKFNLKREPLKLRNPSIEFLSNYYNINISILKDIEKSSVYRKPFPPTIINTLREVLIRKFGKPMSAKHWDTISSIGIENIRHVIIYYPEFTNSALAKDVNCDKSTITLIGNLYSLEKNDRESMFCDKCRINHLPPKTYKSGNLCKKCWTTRMSEYQYIYYPTTQIKKSKGNK